MVIKYPCSVCDKSVRKNKKALLCTECSKWVHITCGQVLRKFYDDISVHFENWHCPKCLLQQLPFWNVEDIMSIEPLFDMNTQCPDPVVKNIQHIWIFQPFLNRF